jgi:hypothetical protein
VARPTLRSNVDCTIAELHRGFFNEVESIKEFSIVMEKLGVLMWWKRAMGYGSADSEN